MLQHYDLLLQSPKRQLASFNSLFLSHTRHKPEPVKPHLFCTAFLQARGAVWALAIVSTT